MTRMDGKCKGLYGTYDIIQFHLHMHPSVRSIDTLQWRNAPGCTLRFAFSRIPQMVCSLLSFLWQIMRKALPRGLSVAT